MAHQHTPRKVAKCQVGGRGEVAGRDISAIVVHEYGLPINHIGLPTANDGIGNAPEGIGSVKLISGIKKYQILAPTEANTLIHSIIDTLVGLAEQPATFSPRRGINYRLCAISRRSINYDMFIVDTGLLSHTL